MRTIVAVCTITIKGIFIKSILRSEFNDSYGIRY